MSEPTPTPKPVRPMDGIRRFLRVARDGATRELPIGQHPNFKEISAAYGLRGRVAARLRKVVPPPFSPPCCE